MTRCGNNGENIRFLSCTASMVFSVTHRQKNGSWSADKDDMMRFNNVENIHLFPCTASVAFSVTNRQINVSWLSDKDDTTCNGGENICLRIKTQIPIHLSWIRALFKDAANRATIISILYHKAKAGASISYLFRT